MLGYALRRLLLALPRLLGVTFVSFLALPLAPGYPAVIQTGELSTQSVAQARQLLCATYDLDNPAADAYGPALARPAPLAQLRVPLVLARAVGLPGPPGPADPRRDLRWARRLLALHAAVDARGRPPGLHPVGAGQGPDRAHRDRQARPPQRAAPDRDHPRPLAAGTHRRQRHRRVNLRDPRHGAAH